MSKEIVVAVSGGFDPIHIGHVRYLKEAKALGDKLVVILNNDHWLRRKKGANFMNEDDRKEILEALECVDEVVVTKHKPDDGDRSICQALEEIHPDVFANGGDQNAESIPEYKLCEKLDIKMAFDVGHGGKIRSSSELLKNYKV